MFFDKSNKYFYVKDDVDLDSLKSFGFRKIYFTEGGRTGGVFYENRFDLSKCKSKRYHISYNWEVNGQSIRVYDRDLNCIKKRMLFIDKNDRNNCVELFFILNKLFTSGLLEVREN